MLAVTNGHSNVVQVLVDYGAQLHCVDKHMCTSLHRAVSSSIFISGNVSFGVFRLFVVLRNALMY